MKHVRLIDANILIRFLLDDHITHSPKARGIIQKAEQGEFSLYLDELIAAEVVWVLSSFYKMSHAAIGERLIALIAQPWVTNRRKKLILAALEIYRTATLDYIDCWLLVISHHSRMPLDTFDAGLASMSKKRAELSSVRN